MSVLLTLLATVVFVLAMLGVLVFGLSLGEQIALGLALHCAAKLAWTAQDAP